IASLMVAGSWLVFVTVWVIAARGASASKRGRAAHGAPELRRTAHAGCAAHLAAAAAPGPTPPPDRRWLVGGSGADDGRDRLRDLGSRRPRASLERPRHAQAWPRAHAARAVRDRPPPQLHGDPDGPRGNG